MKHLLTLSLLLPFAFFTSAQAQQVNVYVESYCYVEYGAIYSWLL
jgi:hypothetical protein